MVVKNPLSAVAGPGLNLVRRNFFLAAAGAGLLMTQTLAAQTPAAPATPPPSNAPLKIGVIQAELALLRTKDGQAAQAELQKKFGPKAETLQKQKADIDDLQRKLEQGGNTMAQATKDELQRNIQTKTRNLQRDAQDLQDEQQAEENKVLVDIEDKMKGVIAKYAADNGLTLILNVASENTPVLWMSDSLDITQAIVEAYDKAAPISPKGISPVKPSAAKPPAASSPKPPAAPPPAAPAKP
jgi:Skp family chaperone for outer membrane proteins